MTHLKNNKWYFWDEIEIEEYGPYDSKEEAEAALAHYCRMLDNTFSQEELNRMKQGIKNERRI